MPDDKEKRGLASVQKMTRGSREYGETIQDLLRDLPSAVEGEYDPASTDVYNLGAKGKQKKPDER